MKKSSTERVRVLRARRLSSGRCVDCGAEAFARRCEKCAKAHKRWDAARRFKRHQDGLCEFCGKPIAWGRLCKACNFINVVRGLLVRPYVTKKYPSQIPCHCLWSLEVFWRAQHGGAWEPYVGGYYGDVLRDTYTAAEEQQISLWLLSIGVPATGCFTDEQSVQLMNITADAWMTPTVEQLVAAINQLRSPQCESTPPQP